MRITIENSRTPDRATTEVIAIFRLILRRDGDKIVLVVPKPRCERNFHAFTGAEKDAYNAIVRHVVETAPAAMKGVTKCE